MVISGRDLRGSELDRKIVLEYEVEWVQICWKLGGYGKYDELVGLLCIDIFSVHSTEFMM